MIGLFSDSYGDLAAFDAAYELLRARGAKRFFFPGGRYTDLDGWILMRKERARGGRGYSDQDFLSDISSWLMAGQTVERGAAFPAPQAAAPESEDEDLNRVRDRFLRTPERDCLQYRDPQVPKKAVDMLGDSLCCVVHDKNDLTRDDLLNATLFFHGKAPEPKVVQIGPRFFITPGQLTGAAEQTCGLLSVEDRALRFSAMTLEGRELASQVLSLARGTKLSVK